MSQRAVVLISDHHNPKQFIWRYHTLASYTLPARGIILSTLDQHVDHALWTRFSSYLERTCESGFLLSICPQAADSNLVDTVCTSLLILLVSRFSWDHPHNPVKFVMTDVDQFEFQAKYLRYLATQQRVSDWVRGPGSQKSQIRLGRKPSGPRHITKLSPTYSSDSSTTKDAEFTILTTVGRQRQQTQLLTSQSQIISPTVALISSALLVCAILPSLLTVSVFVVLLTYAGSLQVHVGLAILPFLYSHFFTLLTIGITKWKHHRASCLHQSVFFVTLHSFLMTTSQQFWWAENSFRGIFNSQN